MRNLSFRPFLKQLMRYPLLITHVVLECNTQNFVDNPLILMLQALRLPKRGEDKPDLDTVAEYLMRALEKAPAHKY